MLTPQLVLHPKRSKTMTECQPRFYSADNVRQGCARTKTFAKRLPSNICHASHTPRCVLYVDQDDLVGRGPEPLAAASFIRGFG